MCIRNRPLLRDLPQASEDRYMDVESTGNSRDLRGTLMHAPTSVYCEPDARAAYIRTTRDQVMGIGLRKRKNRLDPESARRMVGMY
jgi:hypothetical protein